MNKPHSEETKKKMSLSHKGDNHQKGKHWKVKDTSNMHHPAWNKNKTNIYSIETLRKMSEVAKKRIGFLNPFFGKHHSELTKKKLSGENSYRWRGGITSINTKIRRSLEYKLWVKSVLERDNFVCQKYGIRGGKLVVHHINNFSDFPELRFAIDNGITLSDKAHRLFHKIYGRKNNTKGQLEEFLNNK